MPFLLITVIGPPESPKNKKDKKNTKNTNHALPRPIPEPSSVLLKQINFPSYCSPPQEAVFLQRYCSSSAGFQSHIDSMELVRPQPVLSTLEKSFTNLTDNAIQRLQNYEDLHIKCLNSTIIPPRKKKKIYIFI